MCRKTPMKTPFLNLTTLPRALAFPGVALATFSVVVLCPSSSFAGTTVVKAFDAGFVTMMGGSSKGDGILAAPAKFNYSAGFEVHYPTGAYSGPPYAPMDRHNYFVFDLSGVTDPIIGAKLTLWTGTLETADPSETYTMFDTTDPMAALAHASALASGSVIADFDEPTDPLVMAAKMLFPKISDGGLVLGSAVITPADDDTFLDIIITGPGLGYLNAFIGGPLFLGGKVTTVTGAPPAFPQQPFGFTGPDIPGDDPKTPYLTLMTIPEPATGVALSAFLGLLLAWRARVRR